MTGRYFVTSAAVLGIAGAASAVTDEVDQPFAGVRHTHRVTTSPRELDMHLLEIDMKTPGLRFRVTPSNGPAPGETVRQTTREYLTTQGAQIAINGGFFSYVSGPNYNIQGLFASDGDVYSEFETQRQAALNITRDNVVTVHSNHDR